MKKVIEVKRGDHVPDDAKWLKDISKAVGTKMEFCDDGLSTWREEVPIYATFDVFEVPIEEAASCLCATPMINHCPVHSKVVLKEKKNICPHAGCPDKTQRLCALCYE